MRTYLKRGRVLELNQLDGINNSLIDKLADHEDEVVDLAVCVEVLREQPDIPQTTCHTRNGLRDLGDEITNKH